MDDYNYTIKMVEGPNDKPKFYTHEGHEIIGVRKARYEVMSRGIGVLHLEIVRPAIDINLHKD